jgi:uncharacterized membrane protein YfcA
MIAPNRPACPGSTSRAGVTFRPDSMVGRGQGPINFHMLLILGAGSVVGAYLGAKITPLVNKRAMATSLAVLALGFGVYLAFHA